MKRLLVIALLFALAPRISEFFAQRGESAEYWPSGRVQSRAVSVQFPDGRVLKDGPSISFHRDGTKAEEGSYARGKRDGRWRWWYDTGELFGEAEFDRGDGIFTTYFKNKSKLWEGPFLDDERHGQWREWDENGTLRREGSYEHGKQHGQWRYWNPGEEPEYEEVVWNHGHAVIDGEEVDFSGRSSSWDRHLLGTTILLLLVVGPIPLGLAFSRAGKRGAARNGTLGRTTAESWLCLLVAWSGLQIGLGLLLGLLGVLNVPSIVVGEAVLMIAGCSVLMRRGGSAGLSDAFGGLVPRAGWSFAEAALLMAFVVPALTLLWDSLVQPITDWDSMAYHLPLVTRFVQAGGIVDMPELGQLARYPSHNELVSSMMVLAYGDDTLVSLFSILCWVVLALAVHILARRRGASRAEGMATALLVAMMPLLLYQTEEIKSDLALAAFFGATLVLGGFLSDAPRGAAPAETDAGRADATDAVVDKRDADGSWGLGPMLVALGIVAGLKSSGPLYAGLAIVALVVDARLAVRERLSRAGRSGGRGGGFAGLGFQRVGILGGRLGAGARVGTRGPLILGLALMLFLGGSWYLRNLAELGNPLGYVEIRIGGWTLFEGAIDRGDLARTTLANIFSPWRGGDWRILLGAVKDWFGLGYILLELMALAVLVGLIRGKLREPARAAWVLILCLAAFLLYMVTPYSGDNGSHNYELTPWIGQALRYGFPWVLLLAVFGSNGWRLLRLGDTGTALVGVGVAILGTTLVIVPESAALRVAALVALLIAAAALGVRVFRWQAGFGPVGFRRSAAIGLLLVVAGVVGVLAQARQQKNDVRPRAYGSAFEYLETVGDDVVVAYSMTEMRYPLYGSRLKREVVTAVTYDRNREAWLAGLTDHGVELLVLGSKRSNTLFGQIESDVRPWVMSDEAPFALVQDYGQGIEGLAIYRFEGR